MKILIFGGFLGAGKTTVILQMAKHMVHMDPGVMSRIVILENEIGSASVDDKTIAGTGARVETLFSGCVCCTMAGELIANIEYIKKRFDPEWIILETTGMAYPSKVKSMILDAYPDMDCRLFCLVDAKRWMRMQKVPELKEFSGEQLEDADAVLVNKCDLVDAEELEKVDRSVKEINDRPQMVHIVASEEIAKETWDRIFER